MNILKEMKYGDGKIEFFESFRGTVVVHQNRTEEHSSHFSGDTVAVINGKEYTEKGYSVSYTNSIDTLFARNDEGVEESFKLVDGIPFREGHKIRVIGITPYTGKGERFTSVKNAIIINETLKQFHVNIDSHNIHFKTGHSHSYVKADLICAIFALCGLASLFLTQSITWMNIAPFALSLLALGYKKKLQAKVNYQQQVLDKEIYQFAKVLTT